MEPDVVWDWDVIYTEIVSAADELGIHGGRKGGILDSSISSGTRNSVPDVGAVTINAASTTGISGGRRSTVEPRSRITILT